MELNEALLTGKISTIDFDLILSRDTFAQTTIAKASPRCKVFYCFKNDDTREDGEDRCSVDTFNEICTTLAELLQNNNSDNAPALKYELAITTDDNHKHTIKPLSTTSLKAIINLLSHHIDEFTFLPAFLPHL